MTGTDGQIVAADRQAPLELDPTHHTKQHVAEMSRTLPDPDMPGEMPDYGSLDSAQ